MATRCPKCNTDNPPDSRYCKECETPLPSSEEISISHTKTLITPFMDIAEGSTVAKKYRIIEKLGEGGMGVVYKAEDMKLKRTVALKFLLPNLIVNQVHKKRFIREAQTASALNHPHICTIFEVGEADGDPFIAMEYIEGRSLNTMIPPEGLPVNELVDYGIQMLEALQHAHERGIIHRDLKTANVVITPDGRAKILDFGLAKRLQEEKLKELTLSQVSLTDDGIVAGTLHYLAPEVLHGESSDARSDIWALGVVLYEMATGKLPFEGKTGFELTSSILRDSAVSLPTIVPARLRTVIQRCLEKELGKRFQSASEVRAGLESIMQVKVLGPATSAQKLWQNWGRWIPVGIVLIGALALLVALMLKRGEQLGTAKSTASISTGVQTSLNPEAKEYFEKGMLFLKTQFDLARAKKMLERALEIDPKFAEARAWYGFTFVLEIDSGYSNNTSLLYKAEEELRRALQDDPNSARVHSGLAALYLYQGRKELVQEEAKKALEIDPNEVDAKIWLSNYYISNGNYASARTLLNQLLERNPLFFPARMNLGNILRIEGDISGAIREQQKILEQDPQSIYATQKLARTFIDANDLRRARLSLEALSPTNQRGYEINLTWALLLVLEGKKEEALKEMDEETLKYAALAFWSTSVVAEFYAVLGEYQKALEWLELAVRNGDERDDWFRRDPLLINIRELPRFKQILDSIAYRRKEQS